MRFLQIIRWLSFVLVFAIYGLTIWEIFDLQSRKNQPFDYILENVWNGVIVAIFLILVLLFSITLLRLRMKKTFAFHFIGDDRFHYDFCKKTQSKKLVSWNSFWVSLIIILAIAFSLVTFWNYQDLDVLNRKPILHFWMIWMIIIYCFITFKNGCKIKIKQIDDITHSKFS